MRGRVSRLLIALLASAGLLWASAALSQALTYVRIHFICDTAESAEYVATHEWGGALPEGCIRLGSKGNTMLGQEAEVHEIVKITALEDGRHVAVGKIYMPLNNRWGYSAGYMVLYIV